MHRLFVGLRPPPHIRADLRAAMGGVQRAHWQDDDQIHLTLRFIGAVDRPVAEDVVAALDAVHAPAISATISGVGCFETRGRTDALWAGLAPNDPLAALHTKVDHALVRTGLEPERRACRPHITLARLPRSATDTPDIVRFLDRYAGLASAPFAFTHLTLFESHLGHDGARYTPIERWPLG
ncbi:RNA 2',3'-cyclic phosphodiesterase [Hephaestia sp. MAHUQ-44]|nr:RNA 2',3'-cyclic phosphodiesterase [Hephaestia sp. MAHUQ-44]MCM8730651.1 RNA 2',3'-cyclic phosphodiesterase [Hephaestia sp. MAHUQ-44]